VRILQLDSLSILQKEIKELTIRNENVKREKLILDQNIEKLKNDQIEHIAMIKEKNENKIEALKKENAKKYELIEKNLIGQKEKLIKTKENYEERIKELNAVNTEKEAGMKRDKKEEIENIRAEYEEKIKRINETNEEQDNIFINEIENKKMLVKYVIDVLEHSDKMLDEWQNTVKQQSYEIDESNRNMKEYGKIMEIAFESHKTITKQEEAIKQLEQVIINNQDLTNSYKTLAAKDLTKTSFSSLMSIVIKQETQIEAQTEYFKNKDEIKEHVMTIEKLMKSFHTTVSNNTDELLSHYQELLEKQSNSISMLRKVVINKDSSRTGLNYEEDGDGNIVSVSPCSCLPTPPQHTGLHLRSVAFGCGVNTTLSSCSSSYDVQCSDGDCSTNTWPVCQENTEEFIACHDQTSEEAEYELFKKLEDILNEDDYDINISVGL